MANELGAGNGNGAKLATNVSVVQSTIIGLFFCAIIMVFHNKFAYIFTSTGEVIGQVDKLAYLLGITIVLNSVQPVLSGVTSAGIRRSSVSSRPPRISLVTFSMWDRGGRWVGMASRRGAHQPGLLLCCWASSGIPHGLVL